jgi:hypothetical protein
MPPDRQSCLQCAAVGVPTAANISAVASVLGGAFDCDAPLLLLVTQLLQLLLAFLGPSFSYDPCCC